MRATSSNESSRVVNASTSSAARSLSALPARSALPPPPSLTEMIERRKRQEEEHDREYLKSLSDRRETISRQIETLCEEQEYIDREVRKLREKLPSHAAQEVIVVNDDEEYAYPMYDESDSEAPAKPAERRKKRSHDVFDEDEEGEDNNSQGAPKRRQTDQIPLEVDYDTLSIRQKLALVLNSYKIGDNVRTSLILEMYQNKFDTSATWENLRQAITKLRSEDYVRWNNQKSSNSMYKILKRIPM